MIYIYTNVIIMCNIYFLYSMSYDVSVVLIRADSICVALPSSCT